MYHCCQQILEIERNDEEIIVQQDQILNKMHLKYLERIKRFEKQLNIQKFKRGVNVNIPPPTICSKNDYQKKYNWPDWNYSK